MDRKDLDRPRPPLVVGVVVPTANRRHEDDGAAQQRVPVRDDAEAAAHELDLYRRVLDFTPILWFW